MGRYFGKVGYAIRQEKPVEGQPGRHSGIWEDVITEKEYYGDINKYGSKYVNGIGLNDDIRITNQLSVIADAFMYENHSHIKYVIVMGVRWKVTDVTVNRPRITLTLGGEYNGPTPIGITG